MKKLLFLLLVSFVGTASLAQNPTYQQKLYYTCKIWGFVKYYHSEVSTCQVNWDSVLVRYLPSMQGAVTQNDFNDVLDSILQAAGPMALDTTPFADTIDPELKFNRDFSWFNDTILRSDVRTILDTIRNNFRPHAICWVNDTNMSAMYYSYLDFPFDEPILNASTTSNYPDESKRTLALAKYWNILRYFNPYNDVLDQSWDSTLYQLAVPLVTAPGDSAFYESFAKMVANLNDAHAEGLTVHYAYPLDFDRSYAPRIVLRYVPGKYVVVKSAEAAIQRGDEVVTINGLTPQQWEDSLKPYVSAGDSSVFRRYMCTYMLGGPGNTSFPAVFANASGNYSVTLTRGYSFSHSFFDYYPNDTLAGATWRRWNSCNVGYVHMGNLLPTDVSTMMSNLQTTSAIIFDVRNYPQGAAWYIANDIYPAPDTFSMFTRPDMSWPGTFTRHYQTRGTNNPFAYQGQVIILMNQETQSHAEWSCMILERAPNSVKVGSQTAGADGNISRIYFAPNIYAGFTSLGWFYPNGDSTQRIGLVPDSVVYPTQAGIRQGRDEVLEKALQIANCPLVITEISSQEPTLSVLPNPTTDVVRIEASNIGTNEIVLTLTDLTGRVLLSKNYSVADKHFSSELDMCTLPPGLYLLSLQTETHIQTAKLMKE